MRYGICSNICGNLEAFHAVIETFQQHHVTEYICLGNIVGQAANPNECIDLLQQQNFITVAGMLDYTAAGLLEMTYWGSVILKEAMLWTQRQLTPENMKFLHDLPLQHTVDNILFSHGHPQHPEYFDYVQTVVDARTAMTKKPLIFTGCNHVPLVFAGFPVNCVRKQQLYIDADHHYLIDVGSVGNPRDRDPRACGVIYDKIRGIVSILRVHYNINTTQQKIHSVGFHELLAERLSRGV
ncbi:metallophosphoesterase family protein [Candidatus Uabimicrobium amorphum]|uniref:Metallophosphoesterase n=1 Tax=Uabimicrobium amorphum TaxID=2596890 RepID=A0A5S9IM27_UABAM|nr:metallophosphoesterase family protein [Candidatus Uabimicrobium amorphum]BBM83065.1 metallophosphoesterase [Candidatus Uabimicrobium amorphum]